MEPCVVTALHGELGLVHADRVQHAAVLADRLSVAADLAHAGHVDLASTDVLAGVLRDPDRRETTDFAGAAARAEQLVELVLDVAHTSHSFVANHDPIDRNTLSDRAWNRGPRPPRGPRRAAPSPAPRPPPGKPSAELPGGAPRAGEAALRGGSDPFMANMSFP